MSCAGADGVEELGDRLDAVVGEVLPVFPELGKAAALFEWAELGTVVHAIP